MVNPILQMLNSGSQQNNNIMFQAFGAMMRGESPQQFLKDLAKTDPRLQGLDLDNPNKAAEELYQSKGQDINAAKSDIKSRINQFLGK